MLQRKNNPNLLDVIVSQNSTDPTAVLRVINKTGVPVKVSFTVVSHSNRVSSSEIRRKSVAGSVGAGFGGVVGEIGLKGSLENQQAMSMDGIQVSEEHTTEVKELSTEIGSPTSMHTFRQAKHELKFKLSAYFQNTVFYDTYVPRTEGKMLVCTLVPSLLPCPPSHDSLEASEELRIRKVSSPAPQSEYRPANVWWCKTGEFWEGLALGVLVNVVSLLSLWMEFYRNWGDTPRRRFRGGLMIGVLLQCVVVSLVVLIKIGLWN